MSLSLSSVNFRIQLAFIHAILLGALMLCLPQVHTGKTGNLAPQKYFFDTIVINLYYIRVYCFVDERAWLVRPDDLTDMGGMQRKFLTTHWSLIQTVGQDEDLDKDHALIDLLIKRYWKPVYCYLRRRGYGNEQAKDLTQSFFYDVVLGRHLIQKADPAKGRFRSFLLMALKRYLLTVRDKEAAQKRIPKSKLASLETIEEDELLKACTQLTPEDSFNYSWISALLERVLEQVRDDCYRDGKTVQWHVFQARILGPIMDRIPPLSMDEICHKYGIINPAKASNMIVTVKRHFSTVLRKHLRESVTSDEEVTDELQEMMRFLPNIAQDRI